MKDYIPKILKDIKEGKEVYKEIKELFADKAKEYGEYESGFALQENAWKDIEKGNKLDEDFLDSASGLYGESLSRSREFLQNSEGLIMANMDSTASIIETTSAISLSGMAYSCDNVFPKSYNNLKAFVDRRNHRQENCKKLTIIDKSLADEYNNAWDSLNTFSHDKTRGPMLLMREVVSRLFRYLSPYEPARIYLESVGVKDFLDTKGQIKRSAEIKYIVSKISGENKKTAFLKEADALNIYDKLCYAHKHGEINEQKSEGYLYQADTLIKLLLDSFAN